MRIASKIFVLQVLDRVHSAVDPNLSESDRGPLRDNFGRVIDPFGLNFFPSTVDSMSTAPSDIPF